eukprot:3741797-Amphidinium_carterae.1
MELDVPLNESCHALPAIAVCVDFIALCCLSGFLRGRLCGIQIPVLSFVVWKWVLLRDEELMALRILWETRPWLEHDELMRALSESDLRTLA